jgi:prephenate dehydrogenase (NADP+)
MYEQEKETIELGIIGAGGMGRFYAQTLSNAGWKKYLDLFLAWLTRELTDLYSVNVCDLPEKYENLKKDFEGKPHQCLNIA